MLEISFVHRITRKIGEIVSEIQKGNKSIRRADRSIDGWMDQSNVVNLTI